MGGGLMQLVAYGAQDIYLTGNPQITFFKVVYRRHTNFSMETIKQTMNGSNKLTSSPINTSVTISRNGDLISKIYVVSENIGITDGSKLIKNIELQIGGQKIDKHSGEWMNIWNELTTPQSKHLALKSMMCCKEQMQDNYNGYLQIPLNFWFCRNIGLALPLIALQYHEVKLQCEFASKSDVVSDKNSVTTNSDILVDVLVDYIYLDTDERRRFAQVSHEYLIEQVQENSLETYTLNNLEDSKTDRLNFNHPVKELVWTGNMSNAILRLNGHDRFSEQHVDYFRLRQPYEYHTNVPNVNIHRNSKVHYQNQHHLTLEGYKRELVGFFASVISSGNTTSEDNTTIHGTDATAVKAVQDLKVGGTLPVTSVRNNAIMINNEVIVSRNLAKFLDANNLKGSVLEITPVRMGQEATQDDDPKTRTPAGDSTAQSSFIATNAAYVNRTFGFVEGNGSEITDTNSILQENNVNTKQSLIFNRFTIDNKVIDAEEDSMFIVNVDGDSLDEANYKVDTNSVAAGDGFNEDNQRASFIEGTPLRAVVKDIGLVGSDADRLGKIILESNFRSVFNPNIELVSTNQTLEYSNALGGSQATDATTEAKTAAGVKKGCGFLVSVITKGETQASTSTLKKKINVYSFALKPEEHQPSGTCNFSRIDTAELERTFKPNDGRLYESEEHNSDLKIYAVNYNVLRIMSGMGGLAYSN